MLETLLISASNNYIVTWQLLHKWYGDIYSINYYETIEKEIPINQTIMYHSINKAIEETRQA